MRFKSSLWIRCIFLAGRELFAYRNQRRIQMSKRELIDTGTDKRYVRRDKKGQFKESVDVGRSLSADRRHIAKTGAKPGEGDKGDHRPAKH
jgi:hypothetical protein